MSKYALIQAGFTCFGIGNTPEEAKTQAYEFLDPKPNMEEIPVVKWTPEYQEAEMKADIIIVECTDEYAAAVEHDPTVAYDWDCGEITLAINE